MWNERYSEAGYAYGTAPNDFLVEQTHDVQDKDVLCLAEGEGRNAVYLAGRGARVTAVDASAVGLQKAAELAASQHVSIRTVLSDLADYKLPDASFDAIVSIWCHLPPLLRGALHGQIVEGLRPEGLVILEAYTPRQLELGTGGPPVAEMMMTLSGLREELQGLEFIVARECEREIHEGKYHEGQSHVVQVVARKPPRL
jgi:SAM-dependent methyltransferase